MAVLTGDPFCVCKLLLYTRHHHWCTLPFVDILSAQAEERLGDPLVGPEQTQQHTLNQIVKNDHMPQSTSFDTSQVDYSTQLKGGKHGKTTKAVDISVSRSFLQFITAIFYITWVHSWLKIL